jgi:hypothetical protein
VNKAGTDFLNLKTDILSPGREGWGRFSHLEFPPRSGLLLARQQPGSDVRKRGRFPNRTVPAAGKRSVWRFSALMATIFHFQNRVNTESRYQGGVRPIDGRLHLDENCELPPVMGI